MHPSGLPWGDPSRACGGCAWFAAGGCVAAAEYGAEPVPVPREARACALFEPPANCDDCGACCREAFDAVPADGGDLPGHLLLRWDPEFTIVRRVPQGRGTRCVCLIGDGSSHPFRCQQYAVRPDACRELEAGSENCLMARRLVGRSPPRVVG